MRLFTTVMVSLCLCSGTCLAQGTPATAAPPATAPPAAQAPAPATTASGKPKAKEVRAQCRAEADTKGLKGAERKAAVEDCFGKARPDLAAAAACRKDGKTKGLADKALTAFVRTCKQGKS